MKRCSKCGEQKELEAFSRDRTTRLGVRSRCKECCNAALLQWREQNPEIVKANTKKRYERNKTDHQRYNALLDYNRQWRANHTDPSSGKDKYQKLKSDKVKYAAALLAKRFQKRLAYKKPFVSATMSAKVIISQQMGIPQRDIPPVLVEAKAAQLLVWRCVRKGK